MTLSETKGHEKSKCVRDNYIGNDYVTVFHISDL